MPKTNNFTEAWHRGFEVTVDGIHVNIYRFVKTFKVEQTLMEANYEQAIAGDEPQSQGKTFKNTTQRLLNAVNQYNDDVDIIEYLRVRGYGLAHNITY